MEIKLNNAESESIFHTALCNGLGYMSGYGLALNFKKEDYQSAKENLKSKLGENTSVCYEDVLLQILRDGNSLTMVDEESDGEETIITIQDVYDRVQKTPTRFLMDMINEQDDAETADVVIQTVFFGEIVFG